jgi:hypothetical protein
MSVRSVLVPGTALALAGAVALSPVVANPPAITPPVIPAVHIDDVHLAGIGQDIYAAITPTVQYVVGGGSYIVNFIPLIGGPLAAQININYFQGIQPVIEATVDALAGIVQNPFNILTTLSIYGSALYDIGYNWVSAQLRFLGLNPLPLLPSVASVRGASAPSAAVRTQARPRAAAVETPPSAELPGPQPVVPVVMCCSPQIEPPVAAEAPRPVRKTHRAPRGAAFRATVRALPRGAAAEVRATAGPTRASVAEASPRR